MKIIILVLLFGVFKLSAHDIDNDLRIATFNIDILDENDIKSNITKKFIVDIFRKFDIIAMQNIQSDEVHLLPKFIELLGDEYWSYEISEINETNRANSHFVFFYRVDYVKIENCYTLNAFAEILDDLPFVCDCVSEHFNYSLVNININPDNIIEEINVLDDVILLQNEYKQNVIMLGNFNTNAGEFGEICLVDDLKFLAGNHISDNFKGLSNTNNLMFINSLIDEFKYGGVFNFKDYYGLTEKQSLEISTYFPVFGVFELQCAQEHKDEKEHHHNHN